MKVVVDPGIPRQRGRGNNKPTGGDANLLFWATFTKNYVIGEGGARHSLGSTDRKVSVLLFAFGSGTRLLQEGF